MPTLGSILPAWGVDEEGKVGCSGHTGMKCDRVVRPEETTLLGIWAGRSYQNLGTLSTPDT